ncbi:GH36 C-terminal domain-containing protein [Colwellia psychrerythraea]|uniref:GH36 C-terminal domain-containing protein n=1 Tax=Colwellia psychrerythraea TaxID=28229 RepID=UPI0039C9EFC6
MSAWCLSKNNNLRLLTIKLTGLSRDKSYQCFNLFYYQGKTFMNNGLFIDVLTLRIG